MMIDYNLEKANATTHYLVIGHTDWIIVKVAAA